VLHHGSVRLTLHGVASEERREESGKPDSHCQGHNRLLRSAHVKHEMPIEYVSAFRAQEFSGFKPLCQVINVVAGNEIERANCARLALGSGEGEESHRKHAKNTGHDPIVSILLILVDIFRKEIF